MRKALLCNLFIKYCMRLKLKVVRCVGIAPKVVGKITELESKVLISPDDEREQVEAQL